MYKTLLSILVVVGHIKLKDKSRKGNFSRAGRYSHEKENKVH
jgi:hypothetical protein